MTYLYAALSPVIFLILLWYAYILVMGLYRAHLMGRLYGLAKLLAYPAVIVGWTMDWLANVVIASIVFTELPTRWNELVTDRLSRYVKGPMGRRRTKALWVCTHLLDVFDPTGTHCK